MRFAAIIYDTADDISAGNDWHRCGTSRRFAPEKNKRKNTNPGGSDCWYHADYRYRLVCQYEIIRNHIELYADGRFIFRRIYQYGRRGTFKRNNGDISVLHCCLIVPCDFFRRSKNASRFAYKWRISSCTNSSWSPSE